MKAMHALLGTVLVAATTTVASAQVTQDCTGTTTTGPAGCSVTNTVSAAVPYVARLILSSASSTLTAPTSADFNTAAGVNTAAALTLEVRTNASYVITAAAAAATFSGGSGIKPSSSLTYTTDGFATTKALAGAGSSLAIGAAATASTTYTVGYKTTYDWIKDTPGTYTLAINYTLTAP